MKTPNEVLKATTNNARNATMTFRLNALIGWREPIVSQPILRPTVRTCRKVGFVLLAFLTLLGGLLLPALAQTCVGGGSGCGSWSALTNAGPASEGEGDMLAWKGLSTNYIYFATGGPGGWSKQQKIGVADSWYAKSNVAPALTIGMAAWKGQSDSTIWYATYNPEDGSWSSQQEKVANTNTQVAPALSYYDGTTYLAWTLPTLNTTCNCNIAYTTYDPDSGWSTAQPTYVFNAQTSLSPALAVVEGTLYFAWTTSSGQIEYTSNGGGKIYPVPNASSPASTEVAPTLIPGPGPDFKPTGPGIAWTTPLGAIYYAYYTDGNWTPVYLANNDSTSNMTPALLLTVSSGNCGTSYDLYVVFTSESNNAIYTNSVQSWETPPSCKV
jgi:hypothetical protein